MSKKRPQKTKQILIVFFCVTALTLTLILLLDLQTNLENGPIQCPDENEIVEIEIENGEQLKSPNEHIIKRHQGLKQPPKLSVAFMHIRKDNFSDIIEYLNIERSLEPAPFEYVLIRESEDLYNPTLADIWGYELSTNASSLEKFQWSISKQNIYNESDPNIAQLLHDLATLPIVGAEEKSGGTEIKLTLEFPNNIYGLFKPMRFPRDHETDENHFHFQDYERHHSEIAAFHLDKILGFNRVVPVVGRKVNLKTEIKPLVDEPLHKTFFVSPSNNTCFHGTCRQYCDIFHPVCGSPDVLEGSVAAYIPQFDAGARRSVMNPWVRSYLLKENAHWENHPKYCSKVTDMPEFQFGRRLLDVMDLSIFDFLMGNADRHSFNIITTFGNETAPLIYDNGRGFGRAFYDDYLILAPITHCCILRETTFKKLLDLQNGAKPLSKLMVESMKNDPLSPILWDQHLIALDRRVEMILREIRKCILKKESESSSS